MINLQQFYHFIIITLSDIHYYYIFLLFKKLRTKIKDQQIVKIPSFN